MHRLDPYTLLVAGALFAVAFAVITMVTRIGLGPLSRGLRTWLVGDLSILLGHGAMLADVIDANVAPGLPALTLSNGLIVAGVTWHWLAIRRHQMPTQNAPVTLALGAVVGMAVGVATYLAGGTSLRSQVFNASMIVVLTLTIATAARPALRSWGPRLLCAAMCVALVANVSVLFNPPLSDAVIRQRSSFGMMVGLSMMLLTSSALLLWLQQELCGRLFDTAVTDALTGALNRHGLLPQLQREVLRAGRSGAPVSVVLCDLDHFKRINDRHGHDAGDQVLRHFVDTARRVLRGSDVIGRWGGEEFLFVLPETTCAEAVAVVERLRLAQTSADGLPRVSMSAGVVSAGGMAAVYSVDQLLARADAHLYVAKETRDRVVADVDVDVDVDAGTEETGLHHAAA